jgi:hypothetical protein
MPPRCETKRGKEKETTTPTACGDLKKMVEGRKTKRKTKARRREKKDEEQQMDNLEKYFSDSSLDSDDDEPSAPAAAQPLHYISAI